jgi:hypothetical protein
MLNMDRLRGLMEKISKFKEDRRHMESGIAGERLGR